MAAIDFPTATSNGQTFEADSGVIYTYVGTPPNGFWSGTFGTTGLTTLDGRYIAKNDTNTIQTIQTQGLKFNNGSADTILIDGLNSRIGIGTITTSGASTYYDDLVINNTASGTGSGITLLANATNGFSAIDFADTDAIGRGRITYSHAVDNLIIDVAGTEAARIDNSGNIGIGTTSPSNPLNVYHATINNVALFESGDANCEIAIADNTGRVAIGNIGDDLRFLTSSSGTERARIDSSGRLLVGTSSAANTSTSAKIQVIDSGSGGLILGRDDSSVTTDDTLGYILFMGNDGGSYENCARIRARADGTHASGDKPTYLEFSTTADGASSPTERMRIDSSGRVGVGTSSPSSVFHANVTSDNTNTFEVARFSANNSGTTSLRLFAGQSNTDLTLRRVAIDSFRADTNVAPIDFTQTTSGGTSTRMRIDASGRVGIGTNFSDTTIASNAGLLNVKTVNSGTHNGILLAWDHRNLTTAIEERIQFSIGDDASADNYQNAGYIAVGKQDTWQGNAQRSSYLAFATTNAATQSEKVRIDSSGRLLVGTSFTSAVTRAIFEATSGGSGGGNILISAGISDPGDGGGLGSIDFADSGHTSAAKIAAIRDGGTWTSGTSQPSRLVFSTTADGQSSPDPRMTITNDGTVLLNGATSNPSGAVTSLYTDSASTTSEGITIKSPSTSGTRYFIGFYNNANAKVGDIIYNGTATAYNTSSDYRLKENVVPLTGAADRVNQLQVHRFNFIADPDTTVDGFIAHEAQAVVPECVTGTKDEVDDKDNPVYQGIDQSKLVPLLTAALQEALAKIEILELPNKNPINIRQTTSLLNNPFITFLNSSGDTAGSIIQNGVNSVTYATSSDYRLKDNVVELTAAIPRLKQLAPKRFNFTAAADVTVDGFLAHEAQAVVPEAVTGNHNQVDGDGNPVMQGIDQSKLVPLLTAALQEAIGRIETLETKVATLEGS